MKSTADIVIIGGGIQGLSLAYYLAVKGQTDLLLLERNALGSGSSGRSAAIIGLAFPSERCLPLTCWSYAALMRFEEEVGASPDYQPVGCLLIAGARGAPDLRRRHALLRQLGIESYLLNQEEILHWTPGLNLEGIEVGLYNPHEGNIDPHSIMMAYAGQARRRGVELAEGVQATGLRIEGDRGDGCPHHRRDCGHPLRGQCRRCPGPSGGGLGRYGPAHHQCQATHPRHRSGAGLLHAHPLHL